MEGRQRRDGEFLLGLGRADDLAGHDGRRTVGIQEGVDADDGQFAAVLERLVVQRLLLDLRALVHALHRAQHAAALAERRNSASTASSTRSVSSSMMKAPCSGFSLRARPSSWLMISWMAMARRTDSSVGVVMASS